MEETFDFNNIKLEMIFFFVESGLQKLYNFQLTYAKIPYNFVIIV